MINIEGNREALYQWDKNQRIILTNIKKGIEVHFSDEHNTMPECPVVLTYEENGNMYANIPNILLQKSGIITVYIYVLEEDKSYTEYHAEILVLSRPKPADYIYTEIEVWSAQKAVEEALAAQTPTIVEKAAKEATQMVLEALPDAGEALISYE